MSAEQIDQCNSELDQNPNNAETRTKLADLLDEAGEQDAANCQRWMVKNQSFPERLGQYWTFSSGNISFTSRTRSDVEEQILSSLKHAKLI